MNCSLIMNDIGWGHKADPCLARFQRNLPTPLIVKARRVTEAFTAPTPFKGQSIAENNRPATAEEWETDALAAQRILDNRGDLMGQELHDHVI